jgi:hypothetical protein
MTKNGTSDVVTAELKTKAGGLRQTEFPVAGMARKRIKALDVACGALLVAKEQKKWAVEAIQRAEQELQSELDSRDLDSYLYADGDVKYVAYRKAKDSITLVELKPKPPRKRKGDDEQPDSGS